MKADSIILGIAIAAVVVSLIAAGITYFSIGSLITKISGYASSTGSTNITVESIAYINFTVYNVSWGSGRVDTGQSGAVLTTYGVVRLGNWSNVTNGLVLENVGTVNVTLDIKAGSSASSFIGGTNPAYTWNFSNNEANSCLNSSGTGTTGIPIGGAWANVNTTDPGTRICGVFQFLDSRDSIRIDFNLTIPYDSITGVRSDVITATAT